MSATTVLLIAIPVIVVLAALALFTSARRRDVDQAAGRLSRETRRRDRGRAGAGVGSSSLAAQDEQVVTGREVERAAVMARRGGELVPVEKAPIAPYVPPDPEVVGVTRRQFFNRGLVGLMVLGLSGFGAAVLAFLWPKLGGGFGSVIRVGSVGDVLGQIREAKGFYYVPEGRAWITQFPTENIAKAETVYPEPVLAGMREGIVALYQKCPHLGCRVPQCETSQWFECPCHGSQYNQVGEKKGGPAPRGMDRFGVSISGGVVSVDTGTVFQGPPIGTNTTGQEAEGPHCIGAGSH